MATIDDREIIEKIIDGNGYYLDDTRVYMIVEYTNSWGNKTFGVTWCNEHEGARTKYLIETPFVIRPKVIWHSEKRND